MAALKTKKRPEGRRRTSLPPPVAWIVANILVIGPNVNKNLEAIQFDTSRNLGAHSKCLSTLNLRQLIPDVQFTPLETGLARTIQWFQAQGSHLLAQNPRKSDR